MSWLPLYHDMGLIGSWLAALHFGIPIVILSPLAFLSRPARWLWAIHAHGGTVSPAPNFAFDLCEGIPSGAVRRSRRRADPALWDAQSPHDRHRSAIKGGPDLVG